MPAWREEFSRSIPPPKRDHENSSLLRRADYQPKRIEDFDELTRDRWHFNTDSSSDEYDSHVAFH